MVKESVKITLTEILTNRKSLFITTFVSILVLLLYIWAIEISASIEIFLMANSTIYVALQIIASIVNSILVGISFAIFVEIFQKQKKNGENLSIAETIIAVGFSVGTTGCYVCGSLLLPVVGLTTSLAALPLGGLEIKILTIFLLMYSIVQSAKVYAGICEIRKYTNFHIKLGENLFYLSNRRFIQIRPFLIVFVFSVLIFVVPSFFTGTGSLINSDSHKGVCPISNK